MVDWKKEISLSDLARRKGVPAEDGSEQVPAAPEEMQPGEADAGDAYGWLTAEIEEGGAAASWVESVFAVTRHPEEPAIAAPAPVPPASPVVSDPPSPVPGIHPPVPAAELPPVEDDEESPKKPFWKRELTLGRRAKPQAAEEKTRVRKKKKEEKQEADVATPTEGRKQRRCRSSGARPGLQRPRAGKRLVGLKVGASQVAAAKVVNNGSPHVLQVAREPLEPGIVLAGELQDPDALAEALKSFFRRHRLPKRGVRLGIATTRLGVRSFEIADIEDPKQLANAVRFRAQEVLPIPIEEAVLDYRVLRERVGEDGSTHRDVLLVVAYRDLVDRYVEACRKAGIRLVGIDLEAFALLRALGSDGGDSGPADSATVAVAIGHDRSTFAVSDGTTCEFTRVLEWGGSAIDVAVARVLHLRPSAAEPFKRALSLSDATVPEGISAEQAAAAREAIRAQVGNFARQLVSSLQFYQSQPDSLSISSLRITGGTSHLPGLAEELSRLIGVAVHVADPLATIKVGKKVKDVEQVGSLAIAIGLGIES